MTYSAEPLLHHRLPSSKCRFGDTLLGDDWKLLIIFIFFFLHVVLFLLLNGVGVIVRGWCIVDLLEEKK